MTGLVLGGNKSLLFNIEEQITIAGPVRLIVFYDAGQVQPGPIAAGAAGRSCPTGAIDRAPCVKPGNELQPAGTSRRRPGSKSASSCRC